MQAHRLGQSLLAAQREQRFGLAKQHLARVGCRGQRAFVRDKRGLWLATQAQQVAGQRPGCRVLALHHLQCIAQASRGGSIRCCGGGRLQRQLLGRQQCPHAIHGVLQKQRGIGGGCRAQLRIGTHIAIEFGEHRHAHGEATRCRCAGQCGVRCIKRGHGAGGVAVAQSQPRKRRRSTRAQPFGGGIGWRLHRRIPVGELARACLRLRLDRQRLAFQLPQRLVRVLGECRDGQLDGGLQSRARRGVGSIRCTIQFARDAHRKAHRRRACGIGTVFAREAQRVIGGVAPLLRHHVDARQRTQRTGAQGDGKVRVVRQCEQLLLQRRGILARVESRVGHGQQSHGFAFRQRDAVVHHHGQARDGGIAHGCGFGRRAAAHQVGEGAGPFARRRDAFGMHRRARLALFLSTQARLQFRKRQSACGGTRTAQQSGRIGRRAGSAQQARSTKCRKIGERGQRLIVSCLLPRQCQQTVGRALVVDARGGQARVARHHAGGAVVQFGQQRFHARDRGLGQCAPLGAVELAHFHLQHFRQCAKQRNAPRPLHLRQAVGQVGGKGVATRARKRILRRALRLLAGHQHVAHQRAHAAARLGARQSVQHAIHVAARWQRDGERVLGVVGEPEGQARIVGVLADQLLTRRDQFVGRLALGRFGGLQRHALLQVLDARQGIVHRNDRLLRVGGRRGRIGLRRGGGVRGAQRDQCQCERARHWGLAKLTRV